LSTTEADRVRRGLEAQLASLEHKRAEGIELIGWKVGLNAAPVQEHLGLTRPVVGHLTTDSLVEPRSTHSLAGGSRVGVEPEVAIHLGPGGAIESLGPAIEIVDLDPSLDGLEPILAANVFHRGVVLGAPVEGVKPADLTALTATVRRNGTVAERAQFADTGEDPAGIVEVIGERLALVGEQLREGQVIIAGSLTPIVFVEPGDSVEVDLGPLGALVLQIA
jgi:2-oxo-hept-3-ene-1,7-dioate hydratase